MISIAIIVNMLLYSNCNVFWMIRDKCHALLVNGQALLLMCLIWGTSCSESSVIGEDFVQSSDYSITLNSSIPISFSTIRFDSLITSESERLTIGGQNGTVVGDFHTEVYFLLDLRESFVSDNLRYDSITLTLPMDGYTLYLDEKTIRATLVVERLPGELEYLEDQGALYNYSVVSGVTDQPGEILAEQQFLVAVDRIKDLQIRLPDDLGTDMFTKLKEGDESFKSTQEGYEYLRGFRIYLKDQSFVAGIQQDSMRMTIHTTDISRSSLSNTDFEFYIGFAPYYSKFFHKNVPNELKVQDLEEEVSSDVLEDRAFVNGGLGYATKIELTNTRDLLLDGEDFILANAEIRLRWYELDLITPPQELTAQLIDNDFAVLSGDQTFRFTKLFDDQYGRDNYYTLDATEILNFILDQTFGGEYFLLLTSENFDTSPTPIVLGDQSLGSKINVYIIKN